MIGDRLSDLPDLVLAHILSKLSDSKEVVRTSVLSTRWQSLWKSVPVSLEIQLSCRRENFYVASTDRDLHQWRYFEKIKTFKVTLFGYRKNLLKDVDLCVHFATNNANVEGFTLKFYDYEDSEEYTFPQFAYKNTLLRNLVLFHCQLNPFGDVKWSNLASLSLKYLKLTDNSMKKILSGCPNLECLKLKDFYGITRLEINNVKLREVTVEEYKGTKNAPWLEIFAPHIQKLQLLGYCYEIRLRPRNVASLVTVVITGEIRLYVHYPDYDDEDEDADVDEEQELEEECSYLKELLHGFAHVENLELGTWCIQVYSYTSPSKI